MRIPPELTERAKELVYGGDWTPPEARPASTVALLRDGAQGLEVLMMQRSASLGFASSMYVFPGGAVDAADGSLGPALQVAAIRETFEECGVLLATPRPAADRLDAVRTMPFGQALDTLGVAPDLEALHPLAHWITPEVERRRFDTHFFAAELPAGQGLAAITTEHQTALWMRPGEAGGLPMLPPTIGVLADLARFDSVAEAVAVTRRPVPLMPRPVPVGDGDIEWVLYDLDSGDPVA